MKKITAALWAAFLFSVACFAQSYTPNVQLVLPSYGQQTWSSQLNSDLALIDLYLGKLQTPYQGTWSNTTVYQRGQQVYYGNTLYTSLTNSNVGNTPSSSTTTWQGLPNTGAYTGCTSLNSTGINCTGSLQAISGVFTSLPGYAAPARYAIAKVNRDLKLNKGQDPADFGSANFGDASSGNDCEALELAIQAAAAGMPGSSKTIDIYHPLYCTKPLAYALTSRDEGDYLSIYAGTGASVGLTIVNGHILSCAVSGGYQSYNPNAYLSVRIDDPKYLGSGGVVHATTDSTGTPNACVVDQPGYHYPSEGELTTVYPAGADGASGSCSLSSGSMGTCTVAAGGWGYTAFPSSGFPISTAGLQCTTYPTVSGTVSGNQIATVTSTTGTACTYNGASTATVPLCIGACVNGAQATNIAPQVPNLIPIAIPLRAGVSIDCHGNSIRVPYGTGTADLNQIVVFGDPWGDQAQGITIRNCSIGGFGGMWFAGQASDVHIINNRFGTGTMGFTNVTTGPGVSFGVYMAQAGLGTTIVGNTFLGNAAVIVGGQWSSRTGGYGGLGSIGGNAISYQSTPKGGGSADGLYLADDNSWSMSNVNYLGYWSIFQRPQVGSTGTAAPLVFPLPVQGYNWSSALDLFFEQYVWQSQNTSLTNAYAPNGAGACYSTLTTSLRATDWNFGNVAAKATTDPWFLCYRGVTDMGLVALSRYGYASQVNVHGFHIDESSRPVILGSLTNSSISDVGNNFLRTFTDPYIPTTTTKEPGVIDIETAATSNNIYLGIHDGDTSATRFTQAISITTGAAADTSGSCWYGVTPIGSQSSNYCSTVPVVTNSIAITSLPYSGTATAQSGFALDSGNSNAMAFYDAEFIGGAATPQFEFLLNSSSGYSRLGYISGNGTWVGNSIASPGSASIALGTAAGTGATTPATTPACSNSGNCNGVNGGYSFTTGSTTATGVIATITLPVTRHYEPSCVVGIQQTGSGQWTPWTVGTSGNNTLTITALTAPSVSTGYIINYLCGGF